MSKFTGSRQEVRKAVVLVATAEGREQTIERLDDLESAARAWKRVLAVDPRRLDAIEAQRDRRVLEQAA